MLLRWSQAVPEARVSDDFWYAVMTAHGLGAFVGWAGFAVMGLSYWVLASVGFPVRGVGVGMARLAWWLMVLGVVGVIVTTLLVGFGGSSSSSTRSRSRVGRLGHSATASSPSPFCSRGSQ